MTRRENCPQCRQRVCMIYHVIKLCYRRVIAVTILALPFRSQNIRTCLKDLHQAELASTKSCILLVLGEGNKSHQFWQTFTGFLPSEWNIRSCCLSSSYFMGWRLNTSLSCFFPIHPQYLPFVTFNTKC